MRLALWVADEGVFPGGAGRRPEDDVADLIVLFQVDGVCPISSGRLPRGAVPTSAFPSFAFGLAMSPPAHRPSGIADWMVVQLGLA
jgi:hypothetical protein